MTTTPAAPAPTGIHEMVLEVVDLEASTRFYQEVIGLTFIERWRGDRPAVWLDMGDSSALGLWALQAARGAIADARGGVHVHFALRIPHGSIDAWQARLEGLGYPVVRFDFPDGNRSVYVDDPDGNCVELMDAVVDWAKRPLGPRQATGKSLAPQPGPTS